MMTEMSCILVQLWFNTYFTCFLSWKSILRTDFYVFQGHEKWPPLNYMSLPWNFGCTMVTCFLHVTGVVCGGTHSMESSDMWPLLQRLGNFYRKGNWNSHPTMKWFDEVVKPYAGMKIKWPANNPPNIPKLISKILHEHVCSQWVIVWQTSYVVENCVREPVYTVQS
jgi:hypothetical protein